MKKHIIILTMLSLATLFAACGGNTNVSATNKTGSESPAAVSNTLVTADPTIIPTQAAPDTTENSAKSEYDEYGYIKKISKACDENGIYSLIINFNNTIPANAEMKFLFYNDETGIETVVCTYQAMYERNADGIYETKCLYNGDIDVNYHNKTELKIPVTFSATVRAKRAEIYLVENGNEIKLTDVTKE